ncbi:MAG TPA: hypothetical protein VGB66_11595, partial [Longimicrobium sp.]
ASEIVAEDIRRSPRYQEEYRMRLNALRAEIQKGRDSLERGEGIPAAEAFAWIRARHREGISGGLTAPHAGGPTPASSVPPTI